MVRSSSSYCKMKASTSTWPLWLLLSFALGAECQPPEKVLLNPKDDQWKKEAPDVYQVSIKTSKGSFVLEVHKAWGPIGANRFYNLVRLRFFDNSRFYRVRAGAFAQFGIPGKPEVAKTWEHESIPDDRVLQSNKRGFMAYAMTGPDARTTQLYVNLKDNLQQDEQGFAPIGFVAKGMAVLDSLYSGYGDTSGGGMRGGKQGRLFEEGNTYLDREFYKLDRLLKAEIVKQ